MNREEVITEIADRIRQYSLDAMAYREPNSEGIARNILNWLDSINYRVDDEFNEFNVRPISRE